MKPRQMDAEYLRSRRRKQHPLFEVELFIGSLYKGSGIRLTIRDRSFGWNTKDGFWKWHKATAL